MFLMMCQVLGLERLSARPDFGFGGAWFELPGGVLQLHIIERDPAKPSQVPPEQEMAPPPPERFIRRGPHLAFTVRDIEGTKQSLTAHGVPYAVNAVPGTSIIQLFVYDPDGNGIELGNFDAQSKL